ncbi:RNA polymerase sigma factor [Blastopirellula marina]|uniref:Sigma-70 family RNA polymerase sigma factor n=1 Tax=Blastopirellula marina TaxID=124 RepID=A0A2S8GR15_9BACT|nr:sigma-70 family RNA polymerase sigma factor [Blastopirellula marina]PQO26486.1 sigma-70 family RNA polymerase sigma factor [Blastopirellula marina]PQO46879.1 sigma-70 family RNA polymerase sigma factor [Blastopirellula marina]PTL40799.1 sigma-70 family RNA polymerase sigma factor [Blastopirellula marina]
MDSTAGTTCQIDAILAAERQRPAAAYELIIERALERLQRQTKAMMRSYPRLARWEQTDDVFQEAVVRLYKSLKKVKPESSRHFFGLATLQIRRTLIDLARHHLGPLAEAANHESHYALAELPRQEHEEGPLSLAQWAEFHEAIDQLPEEPRETFSLIWYAGMTQADAAALLGVSTKTIQRRFLHARLLLAEMMPDISPSP